MTKAWIMSPRMRRVHRVLTDTPTLAYDLAQAAQVDNRAAGAVLAALERRGMAGRRPRAGHQVYEWYRAELPQQP